MDKDVTVACIYVHEADQSDESPLTRKLLHVLREDYQVKGVTILRGITGYDDSQTHESLLHLSPNLPVVVEFFDEPAAARRAIEAVSELIPDGAIVQRSAHCATLAAPSSTPSRQAR